MTEKETQTKAEKKRIRQQKKRQLRLARARAWLATYRGSRIVRAYRKEFNVDIVCAVRDLQEIGYKFAAGCAENLLKSEMTRREQLRQKKIQEKLSKQYPDNEDQDGLFYYIAGYTSGGFPYGITWEEMGLLPFESVVGDNNGDDEMANIENWPEDDEHWQFDIDFATDQHEEN